MGAMVTFDWCPGDISLVSWRYLVGVILIFMDVMVIFDRCAGEN